MAAKRSRAGRTKAVASKRADIRDVATAAGVSIATVSRVLSGRGSSAPATREKVHSAVARLGYRTNDAGRALRTRQSGAVALMISSIKNSFYATIANEIEQRLTALGFVTLFGNTNEDPELQDQFLEEVTSRSVSALVLLCAVKSDRIVELAAHQPCVLVNRRLTGLEHCSFVGIDDELAARQLAEAMVRRGAKRVAMIRGPDYSATSAARTRGLTERLAELGVPVSDADSVEARLGISAGYQAAARLLHGQEQGKGSGRGKGRRPDALFCGNDQIAYGAWRRARELGIDVPGELRIYGFDDNPLNQWLAPWLDTVRVPPDAYARETVAQLGALAAGGPHRDIIVPYELVLRS